MPFRKVFLSQKVFIAFISVLILCSGIFVYKTIKVSLFPDVTFPKIKIIADNGEEPVDKMMVTVTKPLENAIKQVKDLKIIRSTTNRGSCEISAYFEWGSDIDLDQQIISTKINQMSDLPHTVNVRVEKMTPSIIPVIDFSLESHSQNPMELKLLAINRIRPFLLQLDGVSDVQVMGGQTKEYWVVLNQQKLVLFGLTPGDISQAISKTGFVSSNGLVNDYRRLYLTLTDATLHSIDDIKNIVLKNSTKRLIRLQDVADVAIHAADNYTVIKANGNDAVLVNVVKQPNANLVDLSQTVKNNLAELKNNLPADVTFNTIYDQADFVNSSIRSVSDALLLGLALALIVVLLFLRSLRSSIVLLVTIPITLCLTLIIIRAIGYNLNIMTLGAITASIGLIVDDAIVVIEQIFRTHEEKPGLSTQNNLNNAIHYLFPAMIASSLSTTVIFIPFALLSGVAGAFFKVLAVTMGITLVCSFLITWLVTPIIYNFVYYKNKLSDKPVHEKPDHLEGLKKLITLKWVSVVIVLALVISAVVTINRLDTGFLPDMDEGTIVLDYKTPPGTSLHETDFILMQTDKIISSIPEVRGFSRRTGTEMGFFGVTEPNSGDYLIQLKSNRKNTVFEVMDELRSKIEATQPAMRIDIGQVFSDMIGDLYSEPAPIEVKVFGTNEQKLEGYANQVAKIVDSVPGTADVFNGITIAGPSVSFHPNEVSLYRYGLTPADLDSQLTIMLQGTGVETIPENEQLVNIRMRYSDSLRNNMSGIRQVNIILPNSLPRPLTDFANITFDKGEAEIQRENLQSMIPVTARLDNADLGTVIGKIKKKISSLVLLPEGYRISYGGAYAEQQTNFIELLMILITAALLIFSVLLFLFRDIKAASIILFISLVGISGCLLALYFTGTALNIGSATGIIMIVGIIAENAVFTFYQFSYERESRPVKDSVFFAIGTRIRPKLMTAISAIIALMPLALGFGTGADLHKPLAIAIIGGFVSAIPLLLVVFPACLLIFYRDEVKPGNRN